MSVRFIYYTTSQASVLLPIIAGLFYYTKLNKPFKVLFWFFVLSVLFEVQAKICGILYNNNMPGLHLFTFIEMFAFSTVYYFHFSKSKFLTSLILLNAISFSLVAISDAVYFNGIFAPNNISRTYSSISLTVFALIYFYHLFVKELQFYSWQYPMFWLSTGVLIYFGLNLLYFMLLNYLISNATFTGQISSYTHAAINIIANCLFAQSFRCHKNFIMK